jgi:hypothetical protein
MWSRGDEVGAEAKILIELQRGAGGSGADSESREVGVVGGKGVGPRKGEATG